MICGSSAAALLLRPGMDGFAVDQGRVDATLPSGRCYPLMMRVVHSSRL